MNIKKIIQKIEYGICRLFPVKQNKVLLYSYYGEQYSGAPKYIGEYLAKDSDLQVVWAFVSPESHKDVAGKCVKYGHFGYYYNLATAGTVITNYRMANKFVKRSGQKYIQTWHSSLRLKMIEKDAEDTLPAHYVDMAKRDSKQIDYLIAGSGKSKEIFERSFWYDGKISKTGTPQCDILFEDNSNLKQKVSAHYHIPENAKIAMYAPTFRKNHDTSVYNIDTGRLLDSLKKRFGGDWYILMRLHPHLVNKANCFEYNDHVLKATDYDDVQELLAVTDILFTDYSAIMFDYSVTKRPCVLYTPDLEEYTTKDRNLYFDITNLPFEVFHTNEELLKGIEGFSETVYADKIEKFLLDIDSYDDGNACKRVSQLIKGNL